MRWCRRYRLTMLTVCCSIPLEGCVVCKGGEKVGPAVGCCPVNVADNGVADNGVVDPSTLGMGVPLVTAATAAVAAAAAAAAAAAVSAFTGIGGSPFCAN